MSGIRVHVLGKPVGKGRPRFVRATGRVYTPASTASFEARLAYEMGMAMGGREPVDAEVTLDVEVTCEIPASWPKRRREQASAGDIQPTSKPDLDNILKVVGDAGNGIVWTDDSRIVDARIHRQFGPHVGLRIVATWAAHG